MLNDGRKLLPERALGITVEVLDALDYSHRAGIVHRDIKPANVMLTPTGEVKVMDFGIARAISEGTSAMTQTAAVVGTAQYLSPEQARGETVDSRSDVYSTGCLLYELLVGRPPFVGDSPFSVAYQHVREQAEPPSVHNPDLEPAVDAIVMKALAKRVEDRYSGAAEMQADIQRYLDGHPVDAPAATAVAAPVVAAPPAEQTSIFAAPVPAEPAPEEPARRRWPIVLVGLVVLALLAGGIALGLDLFSSSGTKTVAVPQVTDMTLRAAERRLKAEGLKLGSVDRVSSEDVVKGRVITQDPGANATVDSGSQVDVTVSAGSDMVTVPFVLGRSRAEARTILTEAGLDPGFEVRDSDAPAGQVLETDPTAATSVPAGSPVKVYVSSGPVEVPNVVGLSETDATRLLQRAGFTVDVQPDTTTPSEPGLVLAQTPEGLTGAVKGSTVTITVSDYTAPPSPSETPTPTGTPTADAERDAHPHRDAVTVDHHTAGRAALTDRDGDPDRLTDGVTARRGDLSPRGGRRLRWCRRPVPRPGRSASPANRRTPGRRAARRRSPRGRPATPRRPAGSDCT